MLVEKLNTTESQLIKEREFIYKIFLTAGYRKEQILFKGKNAII